MWPPHLLALLQPPVNLETELLRQKYNYRPEIRRQTKENEKLDKKVLAEEKKLAPAVANTQTVLSGVNRKVNKILLKSFVLKHITNVGECRAGGPEEEETDEILRGWIQLPNIQSQK